MNFVLTLKKMKTKIEQKNDQNGLIVGIQMVYYIYNLEN